MAPTVSTVHRLEYAKGYLVMGMLVEASDELESIEGMDRLCLEVMEVRMRLHTATKQWDLAAACARAVATAKPDDPQAWISWAFAARRLVGIPAAEAILQRAEKHVGSTCALVHYNLACYRALLGDTKSATDRLGMACRMDPSMRKSALDDPDLEAMWAQIAAME